MHIFDLSQVRRKALVVVPKLLRGTANFERRPYSPGFSRRLPLTDLGDFKAIWRMSTFELVGCMSCHSGAAFAEPGMPLDLDCSCGETALQSNDNAPGARIAYSAWDRTTRWFHWINLVCVLALAVLGLAILNEKYFGVSADGKILLKTLHVYVGYVFAINLAWRVIWAFFGSSRARWRALLPVGRGYADALRQYIRGFLRGEPPSYLGHNPLGRLMVTLLLLLLVTQAVTGLVLAGTDLYKPPFGGAIAEWVTNGDANKLANLTPGSKDAVDPVAYDEMRNFRKPFVTTHEFSFYTLMVLILIHIAGVAITEVREKSSLVSAMISGEKMLTKAPIDEIQSPSGNKE